MCPTLPLPQKSVELEYNITTINLLKSQKKKKKKAKTTNREEFLKNLRAVGLAGKTAFFCFYFQFLVCLITKKN